MTIFTTEELHTDTERVLATTVREGYSLWRAWPDTAFEIRALAQLARRAPESPHRTRSSKNVTLLRLDLMRVKKFPVFILEPLFAVPHPLVLKVADGGRRYL